MAERIYYPNSWKTRVFKGHVDSNKEGTNWTTEYTDGERDTVSVDDANYVLASFGPGPYVMDHTIRFRGLESRNNITDIDITMKCSDDSGNEHYMDWWNFSTSSWELMATSTYMAPQKRTLQASVTTNAIARKYFNNHHVHARVRGEDAGPPMKLFYGIFGVQPKQARMAMFAVLEGVHHMGRFD